jgi:hypothetical protein
MVNNRSQICCANPRTGRMRAGSGRNAGLKFPRRAHGHLPVMANNRSQICCANPRAPAGCGPVPAAMPG